MGGDGARLPRLRRCALRRAREDQASLCHLADRLDRLVGRLSLEREAFGAMLERLLDALTVGKCGQDEDMYGEAAAAYLGQRVQAVDRHLHVDHGDVDGDRLLE